MTLLENINALCVSNGITIGTLGTNLGLGKTIYKWDSSKPSVDKIQKVAEYFNVPIDRIVFGFNRAWLAAGLKILRGERSFSQFVKDTGVGEDELHELCAGTARQKPSLETINKIIATNPFQIPTRDEILEAAGYDPSEIHPKIIDPFCGAGTIKLSFPPLTPKDESQIAKDLETMLSSLDSENGMAAYNDPEDQEDMEALKASLFASMRLAKQIAKKKFTPNKHRKE